MMFATSVHITWCIFLVNSVVVETEGYLLNLGVIAYGQEKLLEVGTSEYKINLFKNCLCDNYQTGCSIPFTTTTANNSEYKNVTQVTSYKYEENGVKYFICSANARSWSYGYEMSCKAVTSDIIPCTTDPCSVNINIDCGRKPNVTIVWNSTEEVRVYNSNNVTLLDCCSTPTTNTKLTSRTSASSPITTTTFTTVTTTTPTTVTTTTPTTITTTTPTTVTTTTPTNTTTFTTIPTTTPMTVNTTTPTTITTTTPATVITTTPTTVITTTPTTITTTTPTNTTTFTTIPTTSPTTITTTTTTNPSVPTTPSIVAIPKVQPNSDNLQLSAEHIGIIIGTAVASILLTIIVMCVICKIQVRRRSYTDNEIMSKKSKQRLKSVQNTTDSNILPCTNKQVTNIEESVSQTSTLGMLNEGDDQYDEIRSNYYYVDTAPTSYTNNENSNHEVSQEIVDDNKYLTSTMSTVSDVSSEYDNVVDIEVTPTNPLTLPANEIDDDTTNYLEVTFSPHATNQKSRNKSEAPPSSILATNEKQIIDSGINTRNKHYGIYITPCTFTELRSKRKIATDCNKVHLASRSQADSSNKKDQILKVDKSINESVEIDVSNQRDIAPNDTVNVNTKTESPYYNELYSTHEQGIQPNSRTPNKEI